MPSSSQVKKEEAELRKIAKQSRLSRKEAAIKQRRQQKRQKTATPNSNNNSNSGKRKGAVILPGEVEEMQRRLFNSSASTTLVPGVDNNVNVGKDQKKGSKRQRNSLSSSISSHLSTTPKLLSSSSSLRSSFEEPPYSMEVHHKNKQFIVNVTLHHIPSVHVNVSETTEEMLVVDTSKHTKKYRLELPMPEKMRVNCEDATYELDADNGVLKCVLPIKGDIPESLKADWEKMLDAMRKQKTLRFHVAADGELKVRSRRALLAKSERLQASLAKKEKETEDEKRGAENQHENEEHSRVDANKIIISKTARKKGNNNTQTDKNISEETEPLKKRTKKETTTSSHDNVLKMSSSHDGEGDVQHEQRQQQQQQRLENTKATGNIFDEERQRAIKIAKSAGKAAQMTLRERVAHAKALQKNMQERLSVRNSRRAVRSGRTQESFVRILEEQKRQLLARAELSASIAATKATTAKKKKEGADKKNGKTVTFAAVEKKE